MTTWLSLSALTLTVLSQVACGKGHGGSDNPRDPASDQQPTYRVHLVYDVDQKAAHVGLEPAFDGGQARGRPLVSNPKVDDRTLDDVSAVKTIFLSSAVRWAKMLPGADTQSSFHLTFGDMGGAPRYADLAVPAPTGFVPEDQIIALSKADVAVIPFFGKPAKGERVSFSLEEGVKSDAHFASRTSRGECGETVCSIDPSLTQLLPSGKVTLRLRRTRESIRGGISISETFLSAPRVLQLN